MKKKNSIAKRKIVNIQNNKKSKINKIYLRFKKNLSLNSKDKIFCIGVSGGPDSLALAYLSKLYSKEFKIRFLALIVDHKLRKNSSIEAKKVQKLLNKQKIKNKILSWKGKIPQSNIQANARIIRYNLMIKECQRMRSTNLILAHQEGDFIENFFIRLFRGSGLKGLSSLELNNIVDNKNINLLRPLLDEKKEDLASISEAIFKNYFLDPTNFKEKYLRTKIRNYIKKFEKDGLDERKIKMTIKNLQIANNSLEHYKNLSKKKYIRKLSNGLSIVSTNIFLSEPDETVFRTFGEILKEVSGKYYPPRGKDLVNLIKKAQNKNFIKATLGGCIIERVHDSLLIKKELKI